VRGKLEQRLKRGKKKKKKKTDAVQEKWAMV
jgi:hypothetical protein